MILLTKKFIREQGEAIQVVDDLEDAKHSPKAIALHSGEAKFYLSIDNKWNVVEVAE